MYARWSNDSHSLTRLARISDLGWPFYITDFDRASWLVCHHYLQHLASYQIYRRNGFIFNRLYFFACTYFIIRTGRDLYFFFSRFYPRKRGLFYFPIFLPNWLIIQTCPLLLTNYSVWIFKQPFYWKLLSRL